MLSIKQVLAAGVPLVVIESNDAAETGKAIAQQLNGKAKTCPIVHYDLARGLTPQNTQASDYLADVFQGEDTTTIKTSEMLRALGAYASGREAQAFIIWHNPQMVWSVPASGAYIVQGIWNLRDAFKQPSGSQLYLIVPPSTQLPTELKDDVITLRDTLPTREEIAAIAKDITSSVNLKEADVDMPKVCDTLAGLSGFAAEQVISMSVTRKGVDMNTLWTRKRQTIEQTPGLKVWSGGETFADVGGYANVKDFLNLIKGGSHTPQAIVFEDEIDKAYAGLQGDSSGVTQDQLGAQLKYMQDTDARGIIFFGVRGSGKTAIAKALGNEFGIPTIEFDRGAMKGSLVGQSEERMRTALEVVKSISNGNALFVATCNRMAVLPPELTRRFNYGTYFFDLPDTEARAMIWMVYLRKYPDLAKHPLPKSDGWSGSDIRTCALLAHDLGITLSEAANYIVPIGVSSRDAIETMRSEAHNRYIDAARSGIYRFDALVNNAVSTTANTRRKLEVE